MTWRAAPLERADNSPCCRTPADYDFATPARKMVGAIGFEPTTSATPLQRASQTAPRPDPGELGRRLYGRVAVTSIERGASLSGVHWAARIGTWRVRSA